MQRVFSLSCQRTSSIHLPRKALPMNFFKSFFSTPARNQDLTMATHTVKRHVENNKVVVFSKSWCPYCARTKKLLNDFRADFAVVELDNQANEEELQDALKDLTGQRTVPNIFIGHKHVGGNSDLQALAKQGELEKMLKEADAL